SISWHAALRQRSATCTSLMGIDRACKDEGGRKPLRAGRRGSGGYEPRASVVIHLRKEIAAAFGRHVEEAPQRVGEIAGAMVLLRGRRCKAHLRAPEVPDRAVLLLENVEDRFVPVLAVRHAMLRAHSLGEF